MDKFVVGFAFTENKKEVLLILKLKPEWQEGSLNGIGGKIESGEPPERAMERECHEETGLILPWEYRGEMVGVNNNGHIFHCHLFYAYSDKVHSFQQKEKEQLCLFRLEALHKYKRISNLDYLIPFGLCNEHKKPFITIEYRE